MIDVGRDDRAAARDFVADESAGSPSRIAMNSISGVISPLRA